MEIKELIEKLKGGIVNGWKRLGSEDVEQEVEVTYPADTIAELNALGGVVNYKSNLEKDGKEKEGMLKSYFNRDKNGITKQPKEKQKDVDKDAKGKEKDKDKDKDRVE